MENSPKSKWKICLPVFFLDESHEVKGALDLRYKYSDIFVLFGFGVCNEAHEAEDAHKCRLLFRSIFSKFL